MQSCGENTIFDITIVKTNDISLATEKIISFCANLNKRGLKFT